MKKDIIYKTGNDTYLRLESECENLSFFTLVTKDNIPIPEKRNRFGHVVVRNKVSYTKDVVSTFKKQK